jgi:hypothetical protein
MDTFDETRLRDWKGQLAGLFNKAVIDADGTIAPSGA